MAPKQCVFCEICAKRQPAEIVYEDEEVMVFKDIKPATKHHYLSIPKKHIQDSRVLTKDDKPLGNTKVHPLKTFKQTDFSSWEITKNRKASIRRKWLRFKWY